MDEKLQSETSSLTLDDMENFGGMLPPPEYLLAYDKIAKGAPERILLMTELNSKHMIEFEKSQIQPTNEKIKAHYKTMRRGQFFACICLLCILCLCGYALYLGEPLIAVYILGIMVVGYVVAFIFGRKRPITSSINHTFEK